MRVTKLIKEYVTKEVKARFPKSPEELAWEDKSKKLNEAMTEAEETIEATVKNMIEDFNKKYGLSDTDYRLAPARYRLVNSTSHWDDKDFEKSKEAERARLKRIDEAIEDILITLELGGTKAELEEMLSKVGQGE